MPIPPRRVGIRAILCILIVPLALVACDPSTQVTELRPSFSGGAQIPNCSLASLGHLWPNGYRWPCAESAIEVGSPADLRAAVAQAAAAWNVAFGHSADGYVPSPWAPNFPRLIPVPQTTGDLVVRWGLGTGAYHCGVTIPDDPHTDTVVVTRAGGTGEGSACPSNATTEPADLLVHEFGHVLGFDSDLHTSTDDAAGCTMNLAAVAPEISGTICQHEIEYLLAGYSYRQIDPNLFWGRPIVTRLVGPPAADTVVQGTSVTLSVTHFGFDRQSMGNVTIGGTTVAWESDNTQTASVLAQSSASASITGVEPDTTTVRARTGGGLPSSYLLSARLIALGEPTRILVTSPPSGPFKVTDIVGPPTPITAAGNRTFQATVVNPPAGTLQVRWVAIASNGVFDSLDTGYGPNSFTLYVEEGAYNIRVKAYPRVVPVSGAPTYGAYAMEDYPVCTGGGGDNLWGGGGTPDAEEGC